jgi:hypothetical protein
MIVDHITKNFDNTVELNKKYSSQPPYPNIALDNFLPKETIVAMKEECNKVDWTKHFKRAGSNMKERCQVDEYPVASAVQNALSSKPFLLWLGAITGHHDLIPDPYMIGAGYMRCGKGDSLKIHSDFNWNDTLKLWRMISLNVYLNYDWKEEWHGDLQFYDFERKKCVTKYYPEGARAVLWRHHRFGFHGHPNPLECPENVYRDGFRMFYYVSQQPTAHLETDNKPHRSLYWFDEKTNQPYDVPSEK